jgi:5-methylcytosine-specific restriction endonuclease McrA
VNHITPDIEDIKELTRIAEARGLHVRTLNYGDQIQLVGGPLLVNYYPRSKKHTCYVCGTRRGFTPRNLGEIVDACFLPPQYGTATQRRGNVRKIREILFAAGATECRWCRIPLTVETSTLEHIIPLARGGTYGADNLALACKDCNRKRGSAMPELG